jgi:hypothetical protein
MAAFFSAISSTILVPRRDRRQQEILLFFFGPALGMDQRPNRVHDFWCAYIDDENPSSGNNHVLVD